MLKNNLFSNTFSHSGHLLPEPTAVQGRVGGELSLCSSVSLQCLSNSTASWQPLHWQMPTSKWAEKNYVLQMFPNSHLNILISTKALCMDRGTLPVLRIFLREHTLASQQDKARNKLTQSKFSYKNQSSATQKDAALPPPFCKMGQSSQGFHLACNSLPSPHRQFQAGISRCVPSSLVLQVFLPTAHGIRGYFCVLKDVTTMPKPV